MAPSFLRELKIPFSNLFILSQRRSIFKLIKGGKRKKAGYKQSKTKCELAKMRVEIKNVLPWTIAGLKRKVWDKMDLLGSSNGRPCLHLQLPLQQPLSPGGHRPSGPSCPLRLQGRFYGGHFEGKPSFEPPSCWLL